MQDTDHIIILNMAEDQACEEVVLTESEEQVLEYETINFDHVYGSDVKTEEASSAAGPDHLQGINDFTSVCRTCANVNDFLIPIFSGEGLDNNLAEKINKHLPIKVSEGDGLPSSMCYQCAHTLIAWHDLVSSCQQAGLMLQARLNQMHPPQKEKPTITIKKDSKKEKQVIEIDSKPLKNIRKEIKIDNECKILIKEKQKQSVNEIIKEILAEYVLNMGDDQFDLQFVCQKCPEKPASATTDILIEHINDVHTADIRNLNYWRDFIKHNITFEEPLEDFKDEIMEIGSDIEIDSKQKIPAAVESLIANKKDLTIKKAVAGENTKKVMKIDTARYYYYCPFCSSMFTSPIRLHHHMSTHIDVNEDEAISCCGEEFGTKIKFLYHFQEKHVGAKRVDTSTRCRGCGYNAPSNEALLAHVRANHKSTVHRHHRDQQKALARVDQIQMPVQCKVCSETLANKYQLRSHMRIHTNPGNERFYCDKCDKSYTIKGNLTFHKKVVHSGILPHVCSACGEAFSTKFQRERHQRRHTDERPFTCDHCQKSYFSKAGLLRHIRDMHLYVNRRFKCPYCPRKFRRSCHIKGHLIFKHGLVDADKHPPVIIDL